MGILRRGPSQSYALILYGIGILVATGSFPVGLYHSYAQAFDFSAISRFDRTFATS